MRTFCLLALSLFAAAAMSDDGIIHLPGYVLPSQPTFPSANIHNHRAIFRADTSFAISCSSPATVDLLKAQAEASETALGRLRERLNAQPDKRVYVHNVLTRMMRRMGQNPRPEKASYAEIARRLKTIYVYDGVYHHLRARLVYSDGDDFALYAVYKVLQIFKDEEYPFFRELDLGQHCVAVQDVPGIANAN